ncbi:AzlD family protein [Sabulicella glaciei]|uniref:AzlD domain-containing protein n=1 Tax=Sabulicella glaciei TaxID=2984948 RepID=A0ABT3NY06_9PROT|nr:AzlD domain-containing protein [Roseococcus sp. MDT2-1-1]MCW8087049.1 AzlD domain-containing protein [Roseococcus sp. MDT2-1-1]
MSLRPDVLLAILGMAIATYVLRAGGYALLRAFRPGPFVQAMLHHMPGCIFVAFVAPPLLQGGVPHLLAGAVTVGAMLALRSYLLAIAAGVGALWALALAA